MAGAALRVAVVALRAAGTATRMAGPGGWHGGRRLARGRDGLSRGGGRLPGCRQRKTGGPGRHGKWTGWEAAWEGRSVSGTPSRPLRRRGFRGVSRKRLTGGGGARYPLLLMPATGTTSKRKWLKIRYDLGSQVIAGQLQYLRSCEGSRGRRTSNVAPAPGSLRTSIVPPWLVTMVFTIARPRPACAAGSPPVRALSAR